MATVQMHHVYPVSTVDYPQDAGPDIWDQSANSGDESPTDTLYIHHFQAPQALVPGGAPEDAHDGEVVSGVAEKALKEWPVNKVIKVCQTCGGAVKNVSIRAAGSLKRAIRGLFPTEVDENPANPQAHPAGAIGAGAAHEDDAPID